MMNRHELPPQEETPPGAPATMRALPDSVRAALREPVQTLDFTEIEAFYRPLEKRAPLLRAAVEAVLAARSLPSALVAELTAILKLPAESRWQEQAVAAWALGQANLEPESKAEVVRQIGALLEPGRARQNDARRRERLQVRILSGLITGVLGVITLGLWMLLPPELRVWEALLALLLFLLLAVGSLTACFVLARQWKATRQRDRLRAILIKTLGRLRAPESAPALCKALLDGSPQTHRAAADALQAVLPLLTEEHYGALGPEATPSFCRPLGLRQLMSDPAEAEALNMALLAALEKVGDGRAVLYVARLSQTGWTDRLQQEAGRLLPILQARKQRENDHALLLRGASSPTEPPETLLRPAAASASHIPPDELLRPKETPPA